MRAERSSSPSLWNTSRGTQLLQCLIPRRDVRISTLQADAPASRPDAWRHEWVAAASFDACFRARCPNCGVVREYDTRGEHAWVTYSTYGELLAHGRLGHIVEPACGPVSESRPQDWDILGL